MPADSRTKAGRYLALAGAACVLGLVARLVVAAGTLTLYVDDNSTCTTGCGSQAAPYRTIQAAIDDADSQLIAGSALAGAQPNWVGGGVYIGYGDPVIVGNVISRNVVNPPALGGGNDSLGIGGGIHVEGNGVGIVSTHARIEANTIFENVAQGEIGTGGGIRVDGAPGTLVARNIIQNNRSGFSGGGVFIYGTVNFTDNLVHGNSALMFGGGLNIYQATAQITNNTIVGNTLTQATKPGGYSFASYGGGLCVDALIPQTSNPQVRVTNSLIVGNTIAALGTTAGLRSNQTSPIIGYTDLWSNLRLPATSDNVGGDFTEAQVVGVNFNTSQDPRFAHAPLFSEVTVAAGTTTTVAVLLASRYLTNQVLEYNNDGVARTITAVNTSTNVLTFTPALAAASVAF